MHERRAHVRKDLHGRCWVADETPLEVKLTNVSANGARLQLAKPDALPTSFDLLLTQDGKVRRHCRVIWSEEDRVGVSFGPAIVELD